MAREYDLKNTAWFQKMYAVEYSGEWWPFSSVDRDDVTRAFASLVEAANTATEGKINGKEVPAEALLDKTTAATMSMLRCVQAMEAEYTSEQTTSLLAWQYRLPYSASFVSMETFINIAKADMYTYNNYACAAIAEELDRKGIPNRPINEQNEKMYALNMQTDFTRNATDAHYAAMQEAYAEIDNLIKYGLPSESKLGQAKDSLTGEDEYKQKNQTIVDKILKSEADLDVVRTYILPELERRIKETEARARLEKACQSHVWMKDPEDRLRSYYFRVDHARHVAARSEIVGAMEATTEKEKALRGDYEININRKNGSVTYDIEAVHSTGKKVEKSSRDTKSGKTHETVVEKEKNNSEKKIVLKLGLSSKRLYEEEKRRSYCAMGYSRADRLKGKTFTFNNNLAIKLWHSEAVARRTTEMTGKKSFELSAKIDPFKAEEKITFKGKKKERELAALSMGLGNASIGLKSKNGMPVIEASARIAGAEAELLNTIKARVSAGSAAFNTDFAVREQIKSAVFQMMTDRGPTEGRVIGAIDDFLQEAKEKVTSMPKPSFSLYQDEVSIAGFSAISREYADGEMSQSSQIAELYQAMGLDAFGSPQDITEQTESTQNDSVEVEVESSEIEMAEYYGVANEQLHEMAHDQQNDLMFVADAFRHKEERAPSIERTVELDAAYAGFDHDVDDQTGYEFMVR